MKRTLTAVTVLALAAGIAQAQYPGEDLTDWVLNTNEPTIATGERGDGTTGEYINIPIGTQAFYYEAMDEGEGSVSFWLKDPGNCLDDPNPGYPVAGPMWGLQTSGYAAVCVGIGRASYAGGCQGYNPWSTTSAYSYRWFKDGLRASHSHAFTPGWYKWTVAGGWNDIAFTLHDVTYEISDGVPHDDDTFGDCTQTYDAASFGGAWESAFGEGWLGVYLRGDGAGGVEDIAVQFVNGDGVFSDFAPPVAVSGAYTQTSWNTVKQLFK